MKSVIYYRDGSFKVIDSKDAKTYENDPDWSVTRDCTEIAWKDKTIEHLKGIKGGGIVCLKCGNSSGTPGFLHFYHGHKECEA